MIEKVLAHHYLDLCTVLHNIDYVYIMDLDGNRWQDAVDLRYRFGHDNGIDQFIILSELDDAEPSVFEMMVALAMRMEEIMLEPTGDNTSKWFYIFLESLGIYDYTDDNMNDYTTERTEEIIELFLTRSFEYDGRGSLFELKNPPRDMRKTDIYTAMNLFLTEE